MSKTCMVNREIKREKLAKNAAAAALDALDVTAALAELAVERRWVRPVVDGSLAFSLEDARHPVVEAALKRQGQPFVGNDSDLAAPDAAAGCR